MFIITKLEVATSKVTIVSVHATLNEAIEHLHEAVSTFKDEEDDFDILIENNHRIEIVSRHPGWFTSGKIFEEAYQIIEYPGYYEKVPK